jgi:stage II sporulation protein D
MRRSADLRAALLAAAVLVSACGNPAHGPPKGPAQPPAPTRGPAPPAEQPRPPAELPAPAGTIGARLVRIAIATAADDLLLTADGGWRLQAASGGSVVAAGSAGEQWRLERQGTRLRAIGPDGRSSAWVAGAVIARPTSSGTIVSYGGRRYRGELFIHPTDSGALVVNSLPIDDYLRGVVPLEIGRGRTGNELAAIEAQAVVARSFTLARLRGDRADWDLRASTLDQVYGGVAAETPLGDAAIRRTAELVLRYGNRPVIAPYHSTCGGRTAAAQEVWRTAGEPFLQSIEDRAPGSTRSWCEISPRFRFTRSWDSAALSRTVDGNLARYASIPRQGPGKLTGVTIVRRTGSGRVAELELATASGARYRLLGNDIRFVLRAPNGEPLESTNFNVAVKRSGEGSLSELSVSGSGYGHGVGMCQWGAIARARAGQDFRAILAAYFPGTTVSAAAGG